MYRIISHFCVNTENQSEDRILTHAIYTVITVFSKKILKKIQKKWSKKVKKKHQKQSKGPKKSPKNRKN